MSIFVLHNIFLSCVTLFLLPCAIPLSDPALFKRNTVTGKYVEVRKKVGKEKRIVELSEEEFEKYGEVWRNEAGYRRASR